MEDGAAITVVPLVEFKPEDGDQIKPLAPDAVRETESPAQIVGLTGFILIVSGIITVMLIVAVLAHPYCVPVTE